MRKLASFAALLMVLACSSAAPEDNLVTMELVQLSGPAEQNWPFGTFDVQYGVKVTNKSQEPIKLHQIALEPASPGGPYIVRRDRYTLDRIIAPSASEELTFWAKARATGTQDSVEAHAPVSVRAVSFFEAPSGGFRKIQMYTFR